MVSEKKAATNVLATCWLPEAKGTKFLFSGLIQEYKGSSKILWKNMHCEKEIMCGLQIFLCLVIFIYLKGSERESSIYWLTAANSLNIQG